MIRDNKFKKVEAHEFVRLINLKKMLESENNTNYKITG